MHYIYGIADGNQLEADRFYRERFPNRNVPNRKTSQSTLQVLHKIGTLKRRGGQGKPMTVRTVELENYVLVMVKKDPRMFIEKLKIL